MPVHDWQQVDDGIFHAFHHWWIGEIAGALNGGMLPKDYYSLPEQVTGPVGPDVLTLQARPRRASSTPSGGSESSTTTLEPPRVRFTGTLGSLRTRRQGRKNVVIRHTSTDRVVAIIEVVSPGNKSSKTGVRNFLDKVTTILSRGIHLLILDLLLPGKRDPQGLHSLIAGEFGEPPFEAPAGQPLTLVSYLASRPINTYIEAVGLGEALPDMPLFLTPTLYVAVPLEATYNHAWSRMPDRWREILAPPATNS